ncbi:Mannose-6-phosphate isomerase, cupin superfamily [Streptomyces sp. 1222.5]|uniref:cupin domain-containing protein n=1 Tax=unclassified Streptomyces TaxID=2593676 RepID=UPI000894453E|nr:MULTISPECIES: cupin domain-containing protein [unclassified Streptomyces]PKW10226.1 mannose-6-phosphate isomerase-like protein (cupin superfamily) [Streptomyces sp. 5112.2]SEC11826.1 Mannose-6-phosphate isomerase, cupin superfamily [Streptomyces sp. 1222.5]SED80460.1 Mannose-6-phosphate isomerase, cupin superfamily [Streptomyces sp. 2231.1]
MSLFVPKFDDTVLVRDAEAEVVGGAPTSVKLLADSSASGGALSTVRVTLTEGADGARPHLHRNSAEMFFLLDGEAELLSGDDVVTARSGDLVVVPPDRPHAFAAAPGSTADILIVITPGVERFEYFRHLRRIRLGEVTPESLLEVQELYDNHFLRSESWDGRHR